MNDADKDPAWIDDPELTVSLRSIDRSVSYEAAKAIQENRQAITQPETTPSIDTAKVDDLKPAKTVQRKKKTIKPTPLFKDE